MAEIISNNIFLVIFLPLWIFLIIMLGRFFSVYVNKKIIYALTLLSSFLGAVLSGIAVFTIKPDTILEISKLFIKIDDFIIECGILADKTAFIFAFVLFSVSLIVQYFSIFYMKSEKKNYRFFALLNLFNFAMAGLFFSSNLFQSYVFWELAGVVSYLLIGFEYFKTNKSLASKKVFIINRIGDTALIAGIILSSYFVYTYSANGTLAALSFTDMNAISTFVYAYMSTPAFCGLCMLFITAAAVKSAQIPFYTWLQDAMEAKLPASALLHSATLVASGVFILLRLMPFFTLEPVLLKVIIWLGLLTAIVCSISACAQVHPKKTLAYSTSAQLGLMFAAIGTLNIKAAIAFFAAHAFIKSMLFLMLPAEERKFSLANLILFLLGSISLSGLMFSGMAAKEMIYEGLGSYENVIFCLISFLTAFYLIRIALVIGFSKDEKSDKYAFAAPVLLFVFSIILYVYLKNNAVYKVSEPFWAALTAWVCVYILYIKDAFWKVPGVYPLAFNGFYLDKLYMTVFLSIYNKFAEICGIIDTKIFANYAPVVFLSKTGVKLTGWIEHNIMNGTVRFITETAKNISKWNMIAQSGNVQRYNAYALILITIVLTCLIIGYTAIISYIGG